jgi:hypothetical protein
MRTSGKSVSRETAEKSNGIGKGWRLLLFESHAVTSSLAPSLPPSLPPCHSLTHSHTHTHSLTHSSHAVTHHFICYLIQPLLHSFPDSSHAVTHQFTCYLIQPLLHSFPDPEIISAHSFLSSVLPSPIHSLPHPPTFTHLFTPPSRNTFTVIHSFSHSLNYSINHPIPLSTHSLFHFAAPSPSSSSCVFTLPHSLLPLITSAPLPFFTR